MPISVCLQASLPGTSKTFWAAPSQMKGHDMIQNGAMQAPTLCGKHRTKDQHHMYRDIASLTAQKLSCCIRGLCKDTFLQILFTVACAGAQIHLLLALPEELWATVFSKLSVAEHMLAAKTCTAF